MVVTELWVCEEDVPKTFCLLAGVPVEAGFPSPADDYIEKPLDLNELMVEHPEATFFVRVKGDSMVDANIHSADILVVDRSREAHDGCVVVAVLDGEFTVKQLRNRDGQVLLLPANRKYRPITVTPEQDFQVWGVVTYVIHAVR
ncbi:MAG: polymerase [Candidatus Hydrogenedentes bacterium]|nr:polymerase [Candidatus Hydrogenedentota bacterium]